MTTIASAAQDGARDRMQYRADPVAEAAIADIFGPSALPLAQKIKGEGDAKASALYAEAFSRDAQFAQFYRSLDAYKASFSKKSDVMVLDPSSDFFKAMRSGSNMGSAAAAKK